MCPYPPQGAGGITKLSQLDIDTDKDWQQYDITNLAAVMAAAQQGDMVWRGAAVLQRIPGGPATTVLTSSGPHSQPSWQPGGGLLDVYIGCTIGMVGPSESIVTPDKTQNENAPFTSSEDELQPPMATGFTTPDAEAVTTPDHTDNENCPFQTTLVTAVA